MWQSFFVTKKMEMLRKYERSSFDVLISLDIDGSNNIFTILHLKMMGLVNLSLISFLEQT